MDGIHSEERQVPERRGKACKENLPWRSGRKHELVSGRKSSSGASAESLGKKVLRQRIAHKMTRQNKLSVGEVETPQRGEVG